MEHEEIVKLQMRLKDILGDISDNGEKIQFYKDGKMVGENWLPAFSGTEARHILAELAHVEEYDDFWLIKKDGSVKAKASEVQFNGLSAIMEDFSGSVGEIEGIKYQFYRNKETCPHCGAAKYTAKYPEQKELVRKLYGQGRQ